MDNKIRKASHADTDRLAVSLARAFDDDPVINWLARKDNKRVQGIESLFRSCIADLCLRHEHVFTTEDASGGALWYPPGTSDISLARQLSTAKRIIPFAGWTGLLRLAMAQEASHKNHPREKNYYLQFIGVDPKHHGRGIGAALIKPVMELCDTEKCGAYVESSKEINIGFYMRFGFEVTGKIVLGKGAPPVWSMWRKPGVLP
jgi:ribosomal protein S18 acetylase RimI-like enzyme